MKTKLVFISAAMTAGGAERVMSILVNSLSQNEELEVHLVLLTNQEVFYEVSEQVVIHKPVFYHRSFSRLNYTLKTFFFLRRTLKLVKPEALLSFGGRYNSFAILASMGLSIRTYVSERSRPGISYGKGLDFLNRFTYKMASGLIAQTSKASSYLHQTIGHKNIHVVGNPVPQVESYGEDREKIILNVGRFIPSKHQDELIHIFSRIKKKIDTSWKLVFLGDGECLSSCKKLVKGLSLESKVVFAGNVKEVEDYCRKAEIFAFTSHSEGFPNALAEAMSGGCACISYDCSAGPSDLIDDGINGMLIEQGNIIDYSVKLLRLAEDNQLRHQIRLKAKQKVIRFSQEEICNRYLEVMTSFNFDNKLNQ